MLIHVSANAGVVQSDAWRRSRGFYRAVRQVGGLSKLSQKAAPGELMRLPLGRAASPGETTGSCPFKTSKASRSSRGREREKTLASR